MEDQVPGRVHLEPLVGRWRDLAGAFGIGPHGCAEAEFILALGLVQPCARNFRDALELLICLPEIVAEEGLLHLEDRENVFHMPLELARRVGDGDASAAHEHAIELAGRAAIAVDREAADNLQIEPGRNGAIKDVLREALVHLADCGRVLDVHLIEPPGLCATKGFQHLAKRANHGSALKNLWHPSPKPGRLRTHLWPVVPAA